MHLLMNIRALEPSVDLEALAVWPGSAPCSAPPHGDGKMLTLHPCAERFRVRWGRGRRLKVHLQHGDGRCSSRRLEAEGKRKQSSDGLGVGEPRKASGRKAIFEPDLEGKIDTIQGSVSPHDSLGPMQETSIITFQNCHPGDQLKSP